MRPGAVARLHKACAQGCVVGLGTVPNGGDPSLSTCSCFSCCWQLAAHMQGLCAYTHIYLWQRRPPQAARMQGLVEGGIQLSANNSGSLHVASALRSTLPWRTVHTEWCCCVGTGARHCCRVLTSQSLSESLSGSTLLSSIHDGNSNNVCPAV